MCYRKRQCNDVGLTEVRWRAGTLPQCRGGGFEEEKREGEGKHEDGGTRYFMDAI
jgi:hypothetical protein